MMSMAHAELPSLSHAVFLQRASQAVPLRGGGLQSRLAQSAFLALRLIDLLAPERQPVHPDAFRYQCAATERFCRDLRMTSTEGARPIPRGRTIKRLRTTPRVHAEILPRWQPGRRQ